MDVELQKSIRDFDPSDTVTHALWYRLARLHPLYEVVDSIPLSEMTVGQLLQHAGKVLAEVGKKIKAIKPVKLKHAVYHQASSSVKLEHYINTPSLFQKLSQLFIQCGQELREEFTPQIETLLQSNCTYYGGDHDVRDVELGFSIYNSRAETSEEEAARLEKEEMAKEAAKKAKQEKVKQQKLEKERLELVEYERLRKKFEKNA